MPAAGRKEDPAGERPGEEERAGEGEGEGERAGEGEREGAGAKPEDAYERAQPDSQPTTSSEPEPDEDPANAG
jgi:hypothetical protein